MWVTHHIKTQDQESFYWDEIIRKEVTFEWYLHYIIFPTFFLATQISASKSYATQWRYYSIFTNNMNTVSFSTFCALKFRKYDGSHIKISTTTVSGLFVISPFANSDYDALWVIWRQFFRDKRTCARVLFQCDDTLHFS